MKTVKVTRFLIFLAVVAMVIPMAWAQPITTKLEVIVKTPSGTTRNLRECQEIIAGFNQPMVPLEQLPEGDGTGPLVITPPLRGKYRWKGTATLVFTPRDTLPYGTAHQVRVPVGTKSLAGQVLDKDVSWSFETPRPLLLSSRPWNGNLNVELKPLIILFFNQPMDTAKVAKYISVRCEDPDGRRIPVIAEVKTLPLEMRKNYRGQEKTILTVVPKKISSPGQELAPDDFGDHFWALFKAPKDSVSAFLAGQFSPKVKQMLKEGRAAKFSKP